MASDAVQSIAALGDRLVTYIPYGGTEKKFEAIVEWKQSQVSASSAGSYLVNTIEVTFPMDATQGVLKVQPRKDRMRFKKIASDSQETEFVVNQILSVDDGIGGMGGMFTVEVQA